VAALGVEPVAVWTGALRDVLVVLADEQAVRGVVPDLAAIVRIEREDDIRGVIVTAPGDDYDFVSRCALLAEGGNSQTTVSLLTYISGPCSFAA
jgi:predicted PhzF superfamily epimerase YddE/YHI9